jgi:Tfp pilus assembly protein PilO
MSIYKLSGVWKIDFAFAAGWIGAGMLLWFLYLEPLNQRRLNGVQQQVELIAQMAENERVEVQQSQLRRRLDEANAKLADAALLLSPVEKLQDHVLRITQLARDSGVSIRELSANEPVRSDKFTKVPISVSGDATYPQATAFIKNIMSAFKDTGIVSFSLHAEAGAPDSRALCTFELEWYAALAGTRAAAASDSP